MASRRYAALLRGINVGRKNRLPMAQLRELITELGWEDAETYLQSGQAAFTVPGHASGQADRARLAALLADAIKGRCAVEADVIVRDHDYLRAVVDDSPFTGTGATAKQLHVAYLSVQPQADAFADLAGEDGPDSDSVASDHLALGDHAIYLYLPDGIGRSKFATTALRPGRVGKSTIVTVRNWNTALKLVEMTAMSDSR